MGSMWTVSPDVVRVEMFYKGMAFWIDLKKELTAGETRRLSASPFRSVSQGEKSPDLDRSVELNVAYDAAIFLKVKLYVVDWSLQDDRGQKLPRDLDTLRAMKADVFKLIEEAVDKHQATMEEDAKNAQSGDAALKTISA